MGCLCCPFKAPVLRGFFSFLEREGVDFERNPVILPVERGFRSCCQSLSQCRTVSQRVTSQQKEGSRYLKAQERGKRKKQVV